MWKITSEEYKDDKQIWRVVCVCRCGVQKALRYKELKARKTLGCLSCSGREKMKRIMEEQPERREQLRQAGKKGHITKRANKRTAEQYKVSRVMSGARQRCTNKNNKAYPHYGGRGVEFKFESVLHATAWVIDNLGFPLYGCSIDRIDNNGHYEPGNLRWATRIEQARNKRDYSGHVYKHRMRKLLFLRPDYSYEGLRKYVKLGLSDEEIINIRRPHSGRPKKDRSNI